MLAALLVGIFANLCGRRFIWWFIWSLVFGPVTTVIMLLILLLIEWIANLC